MRESVSEHTALWVQGRSARELMTPSPLCIAVDASLETAAEALVRFSALPVIDSDGRCVGVLSRSDLAEALRQPARQVAQLALEGRGEAGESPESALHYVKPVRRLAELMTPHVVTVDLEASVALILEALQLKRIGRVFVVDADERLQGVISHTDIISRLRPALGTFHA